ncbi:MAG: transporter ATP-binding protein [Frankiales bacterium]|nr:transporter ATP-binding protein [Frankiales bacterium]
MSGAWEPSRADESNNLAVHAVVSRGEFTLDVEFEVLPGEVLAVLGPNGAGKTTLLRVLSGLSPLESGYLRLGGQSLDEPARNVFVPSEQRPVGLVFQNYRLFPNLSVLDNVAFAPRSNGSGRRVSRSVAGQWLDRLGLVELAGRRPHQLSGGQAQRVALARALAADPVLLLLDEPLSALDARTRLEVRGELRRHLADFAGPTLLVTHDPLEAMMMADRLLVIEGGRVVQQGTPAEVARHPSTQYVARLVGLNLYEGTAETPATTVPDATTLASGSAASGSVASGSVALDGGGSLIAAPEEAMAGRVLVSVRPSSVSLHPHRPEAGSPRNVWSGRIKGFELLADRVRVEVVGEPDALVDITPAALAELGLVEGSLVWLSVKATEVEVYPAG